MPIGESIDEGVANQIARREAVYGRENDRTDSDLRYLSSREGWVRVISFVKDERTQDISKALVLGGAPGRYSDTPISPEDTTVYGARERGYYTPGGIDFSGNTGRFYNFSESTGVRPMPGLTSFSVKSKNTYGTLREATIGFVVWSKEDLNLVEKLYLRLGFEVLVEWGHTYYLDSSGSLDQPNFSDYEKFLQKDSPINEALPLFHIKRKRTESNYNQEGMLGYIKNFSWTFREDGGYDCSISVISTGEIIESLTMKLGSKTNTNGSENTGVYRFRRSDFHALSYFMVGQLPNKILFNDKDLEINNITPGLMTFGDIDEFANKLRLLGGGRILNSTLGSDISKALGLKDTDNIGYVDKVRVEESKYFPDWLFGVEDKVLRYIPLRVFLAMVNMVAARKRDATLFDLNPGEKYLSFDEQTSIAPYVAVLPKFSTFNNIEYGINYYVNAAKVSLSFKNFNNLSYTSQEEVINQREEILSILVNLDMIVGEVDQRLESDDEGAVIDFVKSVLSEINRAMANTIDLDVTFDEDTLLHRVIDRKNIPRARNITIRPIITGSGKKSTFSSLSINSKISNKLGAQISIAAQATPTSYEGVAKFREWNKNLTSKIVRSTVTETTSSADQTEEEKKDFRQLITEAYKKLNTATDETNDEKTLDVDMFAEAAPLGKKYYEEILEKEEDLPKGLIPIELSFKTEGIGGLKIGQSFKLSSRRLLPDRYNDDRFAFIITGLEHNIENQRWYTNVTAQTFLLRSPDRGNNRVNRPALTRSGPIEGVLGVALPDNTRVDIDSSSLE